MSTQHVERYEHQRAGAGEPGDKARLTEAWSHEFLHVAMMSAYVAMGCNGLALRSSPAGMATIDGDIPDEPAVHRAIRQGLLEFSPKLALLQATVQRAYDASAHAIGEFRALQSAPAGSVTPEALGELAEQWRAVAELMLVALEHFAARHLLRPADASGASLRERCPTRVRHLLLEAMDHRILKRRLDDAGRATDLPREPLQRRRWDRRELDMPCRVEAKGQSYPTTVRNISLGGALLSGLPFLMRGTPVCLTLEIGRTFQATVMWARSGNAGIKFMEQLMLDDPLLDGEQAPARDPQV